MLQNTRKYDIERVLWKAKPADVDKLAEKLAKLANEFAQKVAKVYVHEAFSAGSLDASSVVVPAAMEKVALGKYEAEQFDGHLKECLNAQMVIFSGLKIDKLDDLQAMIARGKIRKVIAAGSLAMALKKAAAELDGKQFDLGLSEDPAHKDKPYYIPRERIEQAKKMIAEGRAKGIEFVMPVDFVLQDGKVSTAIGPGNQQFDVGPASSALYEKTVSDFIAAHKSDRPAAVVFHNGVFGMFEDPRFEEGTQKFIRPTEADDRRRHQGLRRRRRRRHGPGKVRPAELGHVLLHRRRHGAQRLGQRAGAVSGGHETGGREHGAVAAQSAAVIWLSLRAAPANKSVTVEDSGHTCHAETDSGVLAYRFAIAAAGRSQAVGLLPPRLHPKTTQRTARCLIPLTYTAILVERTVGTERLGIRPHIRQVVLTRIQRWRARQGKTGRMIAEVC